MIVTPGSTSVSLTVQIVDDGGLPVTGLAAATFPPVYYVRAGESLPSAISLSDLAAQNSAYSSGGVKELTGGVYRLDIPDAAFATASRVRLIGEATGKHLLYPVITCANVAADLQTIKTQTITCSGGVTVPAATLASTTNITAGTVTTATNLTNLPAAPTDWLTAAAVKADAVTKVQSGLATPTNITAGTITTVTNLTNAPTAGDFTAAMKTSLNAATPAVTVSDKTGFSLTSGERTSIANEVEAQIIDETDSEKVLTAITDKIASVNPDLSGLTLSAIASSVWASGSRTITGGTVTTVGDKAGYSLTAAYDAAKTAAQAGDAMALTTPTGNALVSAVAAQVTSDHGSGSYARNTEPPTADEVWAAATRTLTVLPAATTDWLSAVAVSAAAADKFADHARRRTQAHVEASADGDALSLESLYGFIQMGQEASVSGTTMTVKQTDGATTLGTRTLTVSAGASPITGVQ